MGRPARFSLSIEGVCREGVFGAELRADRCMKRRGKRSYRGSGRLIRRRSGWLTSARNCGVASPSAAHGGIRLGIPPRIRLCSLRGSRCPSFWGSLRCPPQSLRPPFFPFAPNTVPKPVPGCSETTCRRAYISESGPQGKFHSRVEVRKFRRIYKFSPESRPFRPELSRKFFTIM